MDPLSVSGLLSAVVQFVPFVYEVLKAPSSLTDMYAFYSLGNALYRETKLRANISEWRLLWLNAFFPDTLSQWIIIEEKILAGDAETVKEFKASYVAECNMTAIAVSVFVELSFKIFS